VANGHYQLPVVVHLTLISTQLQHMVLCSWSNQAMHKTAAITAACAALLYKQQF